MNFFRDNLRFGLLLAVLSVIATPFLGALIGGTIGLFGLIKSLKAAKEHRLLGIVGAVVSSLSILYLLLTIFVLIKAFSSSPNGYFHW